MGVTGDFSLKHLQSIHKYLFQDIYSWAGKIRTVDIAKGNIFCLVQFIESQFGEIYKRLRKDNYLKDIADKEIMATKIAYYLSEINTIHPFREGNGRTQRLYCHQLCQNNGRYALDFSKVTKDQMIEASVLSFRCDYSLMEKLIKDCLIDANYSR
jgi:cell filamentation protein